MTCCKQHNRCHGSASRVDNQAQPRKIRATWWFMRLHKKMTGIIGCRLWACIGLVACATEAIGVDSCRKIEYARCDAASHCPGTFSSKINPSACRLFYRDHCLHGLSYADPGVSKVGKCVDDIVSLGECAAAEGEDAALLSNPSCDLGDIQSLDSRVTTACGLISQPQSIPSCAFLAGSDAGN